MTASRADAVSCTSLLRLVEPIVTARVLIVAAHPDDETIGAGALLARSVDAHVVLVTDGAPRNRASWPPGVDAATRDEYAHVRRDELRRAMADAGLGADRLHHLEIADCEAVLQIPVIVKRLVELLERLDPAIVVTHAYEGGHVDHDATALCVHAAMALTRRGHPHEMALYHGTASGIAVHEFLPGGPAWRTIHLDERLRARKARMLASYASQRDYADYFGTEVERYRCAPGYDISESPDPHRPLLYEQQAGMSGEMWRTRATAAIRDLKLPDSHPVALAGVSFDPVAPLVSVIVRTVGRDTLVPALDSIASQTYPNIEVVLVDVSGHGPPASWQDGEGRVLRTCRSVGSDRPKAGNAGLQAAAGEYVGFLDDDDWFHPEHLASLVAALRAASDARVAYAGVEVIEWSNDAPPRRRWVFDAAYDAVALLCENYIPLNGVLFERSLLDEGGRFDESLPLYEDWDFLIWLSRRTRFEKVCGIGAVYRWPPGSGVTDPQRTAVSQEQVFTKWRAALSPKEHMSLMRRAIEQTTLNDHRTERLAVLQTHLLSQDAELEWLRSRVIAQEAELGLLRTQLEAQVSELEQLRPTVSHQDDQLAQLRDHLSAQDQELARLRPCVTTQESQLQELRPHLSRQNEELDRLRAASAQLAMILQSRSWRLTQPLRTLRRWWTSLNGRARDSRRS